MVEVCIDEKTFQTAGGAALTAIRGLLFTVTKGRIACLVGPSGCGKTTTLRIVLGLDRAFEGYIRLPEPMGRIAAVFQEHRLLPWRTVEQNIRLALPGELRNKNLTALLDELHILEVADLYPPELSLGLARRAALARALAIEPSLLLLDEPFASLDEETASRLRRLLQDQWSSHKMTILMITHDLAEAAQLADDIFILSERPTRVCRTIHLDMPRSSRDATAIAQIVEDVRIGLREAKVTPLAQQEEPCQTP